MSSPDFYDNFITYQINSGINDRIFSLFKRICRIGLAPDKDILEIGCGIGVLTYLLSRKVTKGKIVGVDISPRSIEYAKTYLTLPNLFFYAGDILEFEPDIKQFDTILLFDVLEHIPESDHKKLFKKIRGWMHDQSLLLINIPNPDYILFDQKYNPHDLQETDQAVFIDRLAGNIAMEGLEIDYLETYNVWVKRDYKFMIVKKMRDFTEELVIQEQTLIQRLRNRISREFRKRFLGYPVKDITGLLGEIRHEV